MKKMVCEICESMHLKKENGVFVCQDCGTEYSLEEAKNLLREVAAQATSTTDEGALVAADVGHMTDNAENKNVLLVKLLMWYDYLTAINGLGNVFVRLNEDFFSPTSQLAIRYFHNSAQDFRIRLTNDAIPSNDDDAAFKTICEMFFDEYVRKNADKEEVAFLKSAYAELSTIRNKVPNSSVSIAQNTLKIKDLVGKGLVITGDIQVLPDYDTASSFIGILRNDPAATATEPTFKGWIKRVSKLRSPRIEMFMTAAFGRDKTRVNYDKVDFDKVVQYANRLLDEMGNAYLDLYMSDVVGYYEEQNARFVQLKQLEPTINNIFLMPVAYRNVTSIADIIQIIRDGKADNWKEAVNVYDTQVFRSGLLSMGSALVGVMREIRNEIVQLGDAVDDANANLRNVSRQIAEAATNDNNRFVNKTQYWQYYLDNFHTK